MKARLAICGSILVIAAVFALVWREHHFTVEAEYARAAIEISTAATRVERPQFERRLAAATRDAALQEAEIARLVSVGSPAENQGATRAIDAPQGSTPVTNPPAAKRADVWEQSICRDPALQALRLAAVRARLAMNFAAFFQERGLTPQQVDQFQAITLKRDEAFADIDAAIQSQGLDEDDPSIERLREAAWMEFNREQRALLGSDGFQRMREFEPTISLRSAVRGLAAAALEAGLPFSPAQAEQLASALVASRPAASPAAWRKPDWSAVDARALGFLTTEQIAFMQRVEPGVHGSGGRFWLQLGDAIDSARRAELTAGISSSPTPPER